MALLDAAEKTERIFVLKLFRIVKNFPETKAFDDPNLNAYAGKIMRLLGENGAGKSTLMKIIVGIYSPNQGQMGYYGKKSQFDNVKASKENGIVMVHQEPSIVAELNLAGNILLGMNLSRIFYILTIKPCMVWPKNCSVNYVLTPKVQIGHQA